MTRRRQTRRRTKRVLQTDDRGGHHLLQRAHAASRIRRRYRLQPHPLYRQPFGRDLAGGGVHPRVGHLAQPSPDRQVRRLAVYRQPFLGKPAGGRLTMTPGRTLTEQLAISILAREGVSAIWHLYLSAAEAHRTGHSSASAAILDIAEAAEEIWLRVEGDRVLIPT
jgi:hypothetical protein